MMVFGDPLSLDVYMELSSAIIHPRKEHYYRSIDRSIHNHETKAGKNEIQRINSKADKSFSLDIYNISRWWWTKNYQGYQRITRIYLSSSSSLALFAGWERKRNVSVFCLPDEISFICGARIIDVWMKRKKFPENHSMVFRKISFFFLISSK